MTAEEKLLIARVDDAVRLCENSNMPKFVGFLDETMGAVSLARAKSLGADALLYGGAQDRERAYLGVFPDWCEDRELLFPITPVTAAYSTRFSLSHRDFLGALMGLRIKRESVGDILIDQGRAVIFLSKDIVEFVVNDLKKVGSVGVSLKMGYDAPLPVAYRLEEFSSTVSSPRLDAVVGAVAGISRNAAADLIAGGLVQVNSLPAEKSTRQITSGDVIKIRGKGKFIIDSASDRTKKQRIILKYKKYV